MLYSVLMSTYYKEKPEYLKLSIESMLRQTLLPDEIIIVQDGPLTPELIQVLNSFMADNNSIVKTVKSEKNIGLGLALNLGLAHCRNEYIARMDTDDYSLPERCEKQLALFAKNTNLDIVGTNIDEFEGDFKNIISTRRVPSSQKEIYTFAKRRCPFNHPTVMYKKSSVLAYGGYHDIKRNEDTDLFGRMLYGGCEAANINESLLLFRTTSDLLKRRGNWVNTRSYISTIRGLWKLGFSSFVDVLVVSLAQIAIFISPNFLQKYIYKHYLRK